MMNRLSYSVILYLISPFILGYMLVRAIKAPEYRRDWLLSWRQRLGLVTPDVGGRGIVIHCASVGETRAAAPLIEALLARYSQLTIYVTTTTPTGKQLVQDLFGERVVHYYLPGDWPGSCARFLSRLQPAIVILMETELWPNFLASCRQHKVPVLLANARLSQKSLAKYLRFPKLTHEVFANISKIAAQYRSDQKNFEKLGVAPAKIELVGSIKFDINLSSELRQQQIALKAQWAADRKVWIAASIHPAEFDWILDCHQQLLKQFPQLLLIGVPRHPEKFAEFKLACERHQLNFVCRSQAIAPNQKTQVVVGDTMGEITLFCGVADIAFVGGSLIARGGHNPLEAVACGTPVITGLSDYNFGEVSQILLRKNVLQQVESEQALAPAIGSLLADPAALSKMSQATEQIIQDNRGCVAKIVNRVEILIGDDKGASC